MADVATSSSSLLNHLKKQIEAWTLVSDSLGGPANAKLFFDSFKPESLGLGVESHGLSSPASLDEEEWTAMMDVTKALHGYVGEHNGYFTKAKAPAFALAGPSKIPSFDVHDGSLIEVKQPKSKLESSMARKGFSSSALAEVIRTGHFSSTDDGDAGDDVTPDSSVADGGTSEIYEYLAAYNLPRARVYLDEYDLLIHPACLDLLTSVIRQAKRIDIKNPALLHDSKDPAKGTIIKVAADLRNSFYEKYGRIFVSQFQLGGQLIASRLPCALAGTTERQKYESMKRAAARSLNSQPSYDTAATWKGASLSGVTEAVNVPDTDALAWSARGGNALFTTNPSMWARSVANHQTWRVFEQDGIITIPGMIAKVAERHYYDLQAVHSRLTDVKSDLEKANSNRLEDIKAALKDTGSDVKDANSDSKDVDVEFKSIVSQFKAVDSEIKDVEAAVKGIYSDLKDVRLHFETIDQAKSLAIENKPTNLKNINSDLKDANNSDRNNGDPDVDKDTDPDPKDVKPAVEDTNRCLKDASLLSHHLETIDKVESLTTKRNQNDWSGQISFESLQLKEGRKIVTHETKLAIGGIGEKSSDTAVFTSLRADRSNHNPAPTMETLFANWPFLSKSPFKSLSPSLFST